MKVVIHQGSHEIGGSCIEVASARIVVDIGMPLVKKSGERFEIEEYASLSGPELVKSGVIPDLKGFYEWDTAEKRVDPFFLDVEGTSC